MGASTAKTIPVTPVIGIQKSINTAQTGDTLSLSTGIYKEHDLTVNKNLIITGPTNKATIDAQGKGRAFYIKKGVTVTLKNLIIINGHAPDGKPGSIHGQPWVPATVGQNGGGIYNNGRLELIKSTITNCHAGNGGQGVTSEGPNGGNGGGIYNQGTLSVIGSLVKHNQAGNGGMAGFTYMGGGIQYPGEEILYPLAGGNGGNAGGIYSINNLYITNSQIIQNTAGNGGPTQEGVKPEGVFKAGKAGDGGWFGGLCIRGGSVTLISSVIAYNKGGKSGNSGAESILGTDGKPYIRLDLSGKGSYHLNFNLIYEPIKVSIKSGTNKIDLRNNFWGFNNNPLTHKSFDHMVGKWYSDPYILGDTFKTITDQWLKSQILCQSINGGYKLLINLKYNNLGVNTLNVYKKTVISGLAAKITTDLGKFNNNQKYINLKIIKGTTSANLYLPPTIKAIITMLIYGLKTSTINIGP
jgi:hypothetical protein